VSFSVVIPARSPAPDLERALASVANQSQPPLEIIVVDDGLDPSERPDVVGVRLLAGPRRGAGAARNVGVEAARGRWVAFLDADDWWSSEHLAAAAAVIEPAPSAGACFAAAQHRSERGELMASFVPAAEQATLAGLLTRGLQPTTSATAVRRDVIRAVGGFFEGFRSPAGVEDMDLWWRLAASAPCVVQLRPFATYVVHVDRDRNRDRAQLSALSADRRLCITRICATVDGPLARRAAAQHLAIMARYWLIAGFSRRGAREAAESLLWWPTRNGLGSLVLSCLPSTLQAWARTLARQSRSR
jgi:glycosyltransferase involved in cell wall biosynthesis